MGLLGLEDRAKAAGWRKWLIGSYIFIAVVLAALWIVSLLSPIDDVEESQQYDNLTAVANAGDVLLQRSDLTPDEVANRLCNDDQLRVTVIGKDGTVMADSKSDANAMENHASRPEVEAALSGKSGTDKRMSQTDGVEYLYLAVPSMYQGQDCALRVSMPVSSVHSITQTYRTISLILLLIAIVLAVLASMFSFRQVSKPVNQLERVRTDFVANASHELKTPVAGIALLSESIERANADGDTEHVALFSSRLKKETQRLQALIVELIDLSRLENQEAPKRTREWCDIASVVSTAFDSRTTEAEDKGIDFEYVCNIPDNEVCRVAISPANASLIVDNLLDNAISYTDKGIVRITLSKEDGQACIRVEDSGIGIPDAEQERIFERFYRVDKARSREQGGTGLGLSLVKHAVDNAKGTVTLDSTLNQGSTFTVYLPLLGK